MSTIIAISKALLLLVDLVKLIKGTITEAQFNAAIARINKNTKAASEGPLEDRLKAGSDVTNDFNKRV